MANHQPCVETRIQMDGRTASRSNLSGRESWDTKDGPFANKTRYALMDPSVEMSF